ncbi:S8 family serine peptidase [Micromonospora sp. NBC_01796]|uniref:S8 family serine peptidase n=1 Tax=Micromonospora sp. NBC_01796 TaxID=2975987 RepID=UPI002DDB684C|nr:S8 family serine peptidase [Micromonospora sp. NBC_01796]WSA89034.1 S8 family serine peptidase [Micromonospora sp. NBC_01796]
MTHRLGRRGASRSRLWRSLAMVSAVVLGITAQPAIAAAAGPAAPVSPQVLTELSTKGNASFVVYLRERAQLGNAAKVRDADARAGQVYQQLTGTATRTQRGLLDELTRRKAEHESFWIANAVQVQGNRALVDAIAARPEVERIEPARTYKLVEPKSSGAAPQDVTGIGWGVTNIGAPRVWSEYADRGEGLVIANIDSGVQFDHPALVGAYRGNLGNGNFDHNYNWFDPAGVCPTQAPCDNAGHGSHTMGTMVGDDGAGNQIGVAPGAKWMAAKGCETASCSSESLMAAGQWILAPTDLNGENPRPDLRPDIVNNSWGGGQNDLWYQQTIAAWRAAGIFPTFSAGNSGEYGCGTANSPGDNPEAYAVGAYDVDNNIAEFSSRGSSLVDGQPKPNVSAPGVDIVSSIPGNQYGISSGTSMAAPHLSGAVALIWSAAPLLRGDVAATEKLLDDTAIDVESLGCGGTVDDNNNFGEGRLDVYRAVTAAPRGPVTRISGTVAVLGSREPIANATVAVNGRTARTDQFGHYTLPVVEGTYTATVEAYGFTGQTATVIAAGTQVTLDFALAALPLVTLSGKVTDASGQGWPLYSRIEVAGRPGGPVFTDPTSGRYSLTVPAGGTYRLTTTAVSAGYRSVSTEVTVANRARTANIGVPAAVACQLDGYTAGIGRTLLSESFAGPGAPAGWSVVNRADSGWAFDNPGNRENLTGGSGGFAIADSDHYGLGRAQDTDLVSPVIDLSTVDAPVLRFASDLYIGGNGDAASIDVSTNGGVDWVGVAMQQVSRRGPAAEEVPLPTLANQANAQIRFRYRGEYSWWWQIDNVEVVDRTCTPVPGGLVAGFTTDANTGAGLNGVPVSSPDRPAERSVSAATPEDRSIGDGFYSFFSTLVDGKHPFVAGLAPYQNRSKSSTIATGDARRVDFDLKVGRLALGSTEIKTTLPYGSSRNTEVTVTNTGSAPTTVEVLERDGGYAALAAGRGAPLTEYKVPKVSAGMFAGSGKPAARTGAVTPLDDSWSRIADLPAPVYDNAAALVGGKVYSVGGGTTDREEKREAYVYDPATDAWQTLPDMPHSRYKPAAAAVDGKLYVFGGWTPDGGTEPAVDVFDPATGAWQTLPGVGNPAARAAGTASVIEGQVYLVGGCLDFLCNASTDVVAFDPAGNTFRVKAAYPHEVAWQSCGAIGVRVYCAGGFSHESGYTDGYAYAPDTDTWSPIADLPIDLWGSQYSVAGGRLVLAGGVIDEGQTLTNRTIGYDPAANAWQDLPNTLVPRVRGAGACGGFKIGGAAFAPLAGPESERMTGLGLCDESTDVAWLTASPNRFTLAPGASKAITLRIVANGAHGINQPGDYLAQLALRADTPYAVPTLGITLTVQPKGNRGF